MQSRYYDPEVGRFINADVLVSSGQGILGSNMFAYCRNNPVRRIDITGTTDADCVGNDDGELLSSDELESRGNGGGDIWGSILSAIDGVSYGLGMAMGSAPKSPEMISPKYIKANNIDAHNFKQQAGKVSPKQQSRYDIYKDKANHNRLWVGNKNPKNRDWRPTEYFFKDLCDNWRK